MPCKVLIVDDSALMRQLLTEVLESDRSISVVGTAPDPIVARQKIKDLNPDVITLDVEMPKMDGLAFLEKIMTLRPTPVVMISSLTKKGSDVTLQALELGAVDFVPKPVIDADRGLEALKEEICEKVKTAALARVKPIARATGGSIKRLMPGPGYSTTEKIVAIGASTGGVEALHALLSAFPADSPAILVVQHMPQAFTSRFAQRLALNCAMAVTEAKDGERILPGHAYIAPGNRHLEVKRSGADYICHLTESALVSGHRPSADVLFHSVAIAAGQNALGIILTGMGKDGAEGLLQMRAAGAHTIGQDEASCVVYGMPKAAMSLGATAVELPLLRIPQEILLYCRKTNQGVRR